MGYNHREYNAVYGLERYYLHRSLGLCSCKEAVEPGKTRCKSCGEKNTKGAGVLRARRKAAGLCAQCGKQPLREGYAVCEPCRAHRESVLNARKEKWRKQGRCTRCGGMRDTFGRELCSKHHEPYTDGRRKTIEERRAYWALYSLRGYEFNTGVRWLFFLPGEALSRMCEKKGASGLSSGLSRLRWFTPS